MTERKLVIRKGEPEDLAALRTLYLRVKSRQRPIDYDRWHFYSDELGQTILVVALDGEACVGVYVIWPAKIRIGDEVVAGAQAIDLMVHPAYRRAGLFLELAEFGHGLAAEMGIEVIYGFTNRQSPPFFGFTRRLDWAHVGDIPFWARPLGFTRLPATVNTWARFALRALPRNKTGDFEIRYQRPANDLIERLLDECRRESQECRVDRDVQWYAWRHSPSSGKHYEWVSAYDRAGLAAYAIWGRSAHHAATTGAAVGSIVEIIGRDRRCCGAVVSAVIDLAWQLSLDRLTGFTNDPFTINVLRGNFFFRRNRFARSLIVRGIGSRFGTKDICERGWQIMGTDFDRL